MTYNLSFALGAIGVLLGQTVSLATGLDQEKPLLFANDYAWYPDGEHVGRIWAGWTRPEAARNARALAACIDAFAVYSTFSHFRAHRCKDLAGSYCYLGEPAHQAGRAMLLPVHAGRNNSRFWGDPYVMPRLEGQTLRDYLRAATDARADFIMITSWNEWPETTVIEPSSTWPDPHLYLNIATEWKGKVFSIPPDPTKEETFSPGD